MPELDNEYNRADIELEIPLARAVLCNLTPATAIIIDIGYTQI